MGLRLARVTLHPVHQSPVQKMTRVRVAIATRVDPLALQVKLVLIQFDRVAKKDVPPSSKHKGYDEYTRFDTGSKARQKLVLTQPMEEFLSDKFTHYVKDKTIQDLFN